MPPNNTLKRLHAFWPWLLIISPAIFLLAEMAPLLVPVPCLDSWSFVQQYKEIIEDRYSLEGFFAPNYVHPSATGKTIYFAVLHFCGGNVAILPVISWIFSALIAAAVYVLAKPLWRENKWLTALMLFTATSIIFTAAQGEVWLWDFVFQNFIPGTVLAVSLLILLNGKLQSWKLVLTGFLGILSTHSFATGFLVPVLLCIPIWRGMRDRTTTYKTVFAVIWLVIHGAVALHALTASGGSDKGPDLGIGIIFDRPLMRLHFLCILLGNVLGKGTVFEPSTLCAFFGGALLLIFLACSLFLWLRRSDESLMKASLPWLLFALYGLGASGLISIGRMQRSLDNSMDERFGTFTIFFIFGTLLFAYTIYSRIASSGSPLFPAVRLASSPAFGILVAGIIVNWGVGLNFMHIKHSRMDQERALLTFAKVLPLENNEWMEARITRKSSFHLSIFLEQQGRLKGVKFAKDTSLDEFKRGKKMGAKYASFDPPLELGDGRWRLSGTGGLAVDNVADLILITAEGTDASERIVGLAAPLMPTNFFERQKEVRNNPEYYLGWSHTLFEAKLPAGPITLRAYVFDQDKRSIHPIEGVHRLRDAQRPSAIGESLGPPTPAGTL